jgi:hypothetical protein
MEQKETLVAEKAHQALVAVDKGSCLPCLAKGYVKHILLIQEHSPPHFAHHQSPILYN